MVGLGTIIRWVLYLVGPGVLKTLLDKSGIDGCGKLTIAVSLAIVSVLLYFIPLVGFGIEALVNFVALLLEPVG